MLNKDTFKLLISETVKGIIWKIVLDDKEQILLIESRTENHEVFFYAYDFKKASFLMKEKTFEAKWFIGISGIYNGIAYFQGFENEYSPVRKEIIAFDLYQQKICWQNYNYALESLSADGVVAFNTKIQPKRLELLNLETGLLLANIKQENLADYPMVANQLQIPSYHFKKEIQNSFQELIINSLKIRSYYKEEDNLLNHILEIYQNDDLFFTDYLDRDVQKVTPDTFFVWFNKLVYIKNKSDIVVYLL